jgi:type I restriction enzyme S subunit
MASLRYLEDSWLGQIPSHWIKVPAKSLFWNPVEKNQADDIHLTPSQKYGVLPQSAYMEITGNRVVLNLSGSDNMRHVEPGDFISHLRSFQGGLEHSSIKGKVSSAYTVLRPKREIEPIFYKYLFKSGRYVQGLSTTTEQLRDGQSIRYEQFALLPLPYPPLHEQKEIVNFLDEELKKIDQLISRKEELVTRLRERSEATICHLVTHGINPDVKLEDSGVEWSPKKPDNWLTLPLFTQGREVSTKNKGMLEKNLLSLSYGEIVSKDINTSEGLLPESFDTYQIIEPGDIVFRFTDLQNDKKSLRSALCRERGIITSAYLAFRVEAGNPEFLSYQMRAWDLMKVFYAMGSGLRQSLKFSDVKNMPVLIPPRPEQDQIVFNIKQMQAKSELIINRVSRAIENLRERRATLISDAVTGKIEIRGKADGGL